MAKKRGYAHFKHKKPAQNNPFVQVFGIFQDKTIIMHQMNLAQNRHFAQKPLLE